MEDIDFLKQQIEFLEFQLEDSKTREIQTKNMYESMLKSYSEPQENQNLHHKQIEKELESKLSILELKHKEKICELEAIISDLKYQKEASEFQNNSVRSSLENKILKLSTELESKNFSLSELSNTLKKYKKKLKSKEKEILKTQQEKDELLNKYNEDLKFTESEGNERLEQLKSIYDVEKTSLKLIISKLESENKSPIKIFSTILGETSESKEKMKTLEENFKKSLETCREFIKITPSDTENQSNLIKNLPFKDRLDLTEKMLKFSSIISEKIEKFETTILTLKKHIPHKEDYEKKIKDILLKKNEEIETLQRTISLKASETSNTNTNKLIDELVRKDSEINKLKRIIGDLQENDKKTKPPTYTPNHRRSKTMSFTSQIQPKPVLSLDLSSLNSPSKSNDDPDQTTASTDRSPSGKLELFENKIKTLKSTLAKIKNQRDKAKSTSEKILKELSTKKIELAMLNNEYSDFKQSTTQQIKFLAGYSQTLSRSPLVPKMLKQDLSKILSNYSQYLE